MFARLGMVALAFALSTPVQARAGGSWTSGVGYSGANVLVPTVCGRS
jgi:hypothetical protein